MLGSQNVPPLSMANAYATFASGGKYCKPIAIDQILDASGTSMAVPSADCTQAMDQGAADQTATTLTGPRHREAVRLRTPSSVDRSAARPEPRMTTKNAWFVGFTPQLATAVWIGRRRQPQDPQLPGDRPGLLGIMYGSDLAVPMWRDYMSQAVANDPALPIPSHG